ncbi:MAG: hypothetical protein Q9181_005158 [Wetmoreana brouardii]
MAYVSLPDGDSVRDYQDFVYDRSAGTGVNVYIVDTGAGLTNNDEFARFVIPNCRWIHAAGAQVFAPLQSDIYGVGHGTGILAKAAGWKHGIAKRSNPIIVRVPDLGDPAAWSNGVQRVYADWRPVYDRDPKTATAILNLSWGFSRAKLAAAGYNNQQQDTWIADLRNTLNDCVNIGLLPVDQYPQLLAYGLSPAVPNLMIVGGVTTEGKIWEQSKVDIDPDIEVIKVHAPSKDLTTPDALTGGWRPGIVNGVSYGKVQSGACAACVGSMLTAVTIASGTVAGLGAYFLGLSSLQDLLLDDDPMQRVENLKDLLEIGSSLRRGDGLRSLYNEKDPRACPPDVPNGFQDGDEVSCRDTGSASGNTVLAIRNCYITTMDPTPTAGITTPEPKCSCTDGAMAGVGSGTVSGTTYSWCQTGDLPSGVPPEATALEPVTQQSPTTVAPATTAPPATVPLESQCIHVFAKSPRHTVTCSSSIKKEDLSTPLPDGAWTCISAGWGKLCSCQAEGDAQPCLPADEFAKGEKRDLPPEILQAGVRPTAALIPV